MVSVTDIVKGFKANLEKVTGHVVEKLAIMRNNKPEAVIVPVDEYEKMFEFGKGFGFILGCLMSLGYVIHLHRPQKWQKALSLGQKKDHGKNWKNHLKNRAQQLFPQCEVTLKTADALLILEYARSLGGNKPQPLPLGGGEDYTSPNL